MADPIKLKVVDPPGKIGAGSSVNKTPIYDQMDARDILSMFAGSGATSLADPEIKKHYGRLSNIVGAPTAQKLFNQVSLYNQRPEVLGMKPEQRVSGFFNLGSSDPVINTYLKGAAGLGYGALPGFRDSPLLGNRILNNKDVTGAGDLSAADKIKLLVKNNIK